MGHWGYLPWDNDSAADWFGDLFDETKLANRVEATLKLDPKESPDKIRAAAAVVLLMGHTYVWPNELDQHLALASDRLEEILRLGIYSEAPDLEETVRQEIQELRGRIKNSASTLAPDQPKPSKRNWWEFWK
jgi:hypothetical protein